MGRTINSTKLTKEYVLSHVSQISIFSTYLNISTDTIQHCISTGELIISPIRDDKHPTCGFKYDNRGKLKFRDFAGYFWGDCFDVVAMVISHLYNTKIDINKKEDFIKVLRHITIVFKDIFQGRERDSILVENIHNTILNIKKEKPIIDLVTRQWNQQDIKYWTQFGIDIQYLNVNFVFPVEQYYINIKINPEPKYYYNTKDPCYAYCLGKDINNVYSFKLYFPNRSKEQNRFITNCNHLEGIISLNDINYDYIIITKSSKDRLSIGNTLLKMSSLYGQANKKIGVINIPHETYKLKQTEYEWLNNKLTDNGLLVSLMDNDRTGKLEAIWLVDTYNITPLLIPKNSGCKDFAEFYSKYEKTYIYETINNVINNIKIYDKRIQSNRNKKKNNSLPY